MPGSRNISFSQLIIEFISVVFAVLLALGLNAYKEAANAKKEAIKLKQAIIQECKNNLSKLDSVTVNNKAYLDYLDSLVQIGPSYTKGTFYFTFEFQHLTNGAWTIAQNNPAVNELEQQFLMDAADLYQGQEFYKSFAFSVFEKVGPMIIDYERLKAANLAQSMHYNISVLFNSISELKKGYQEFLEKYDQK